MTWGGGLGSTIGGFTGSRDPVPAPQQQQANYGDLWNTFMTGVLGPQDSAANYGLAGLGLQRGLADVNYNYGVSDINAQRGFGIERLGLDEAALNRARQTNPELFALQNRLFDIQGQRIGLSRGGLGLEREGVGVAREGTALQRAVAQFQREQADRGAWSNSTARGATNTSGFEQQLSDIGTTLQQRLAGIGLQEKDIDIREKGIGLREQGLGLDEQTLAVHRRQHELSQQDQEAQINDTAARLGLQRRELDQRVSSALNKLGLDRALSTVDIINGIYDIQNGRVSAIGGVLSAISQFDPRLLQGGTVVQK